MKIRIILLTTFFIRLSFAAHSQTHHHLQKHNEQWALAKINALPEVKDFMQYARKSNPDLELKNIPDLTNKYYCIALGINNFGMFRTSTNYFVDPKNGKIYVNDVMDNSTDDLWHIISLQQVRYWRKDPRFHHWHTIKENRLIVLDENGKIINDKKKNITINRE